MKIIQAGYKIIDALDGNQILKKIEQCGRVAYKSEATEGSAEKFIKKIIKSGHESVLEHFSFTVKFICDRGVSHEIVRHRLASYTQESTRYCNYSNDKFGGEITVIEPLFLLPGTDGYELWKNACEWAEVNYFALLDYGCSPQEARSVLPNSLKTEVVMTANLREWRHFFKLRTATAAHPQMREIAIPLLIELQRKIPVIFDDIICPESSRTRTETYKDSKIDSCIIKCFNFDENGNILVEEICLNCRPCEYFKVQDGFKVVQDKNDHLEPVQS